MGGSRFIPPTNPIKNSIRVYNLSDEVFSLSLSSQFSTSNPSYVDLSDTSARMKFGSEKGTAVLGGPSGVNVYFIGGVQQNLTRLNEIDKNSNITSNQTLMVEEINKTYNMTNQSVFFYQPYGKSWLNVLDQKECSRLDINAANVPSPRSHAAPVMLPNVDADLIDMNEIPVFDTISSTWSYKYASQSILVQPRLAHTATLMPDNNEIIIIGGNSKPYEYSELITSGDKPPPLAFHIANLYQNYLIIAFGNITNYATEPAEISSRIYLLDIQCKTWVMTFTPGRSICSNGLSIGSGSNVSNGPGINIGMIVGIIVGSIIVVAVIVVAILRLIKPKKLHVATDQNFEPESE
ncbi:23183_t:CDS:2, partial [Gigaspora margarita]